MRPELKEMAEDTVEKMVRLAEEWDGEDIIRKGDMEIKVIKRVGRELKAEITFSGEYDCSTLLAIAGKFIEQCIQKQVLWPDIDDWGWQVKVHNGYYEEPQVIEIECTDWDS